jgi:hypothetical protein
MYAYNQHTGPGKRLAMHISPSSVPPWFNALQAQVLDLILIFAMASAANTLVEGVHVLLVSDKYVL